MFIGPIRKSCLHEIVIQCVNKNVSQSVSQSMNPPAPSVLLLILDSLPLILLLLNPLNFVLFHPLSLKSGTLSLLISATCKLFPSSSLGSRPIFSNLLLISKLLFFKSFTPIDNECLFLSIFELHLMLFIVYYIFELI